MEEKDLWTTFEKTGSVVDYLNYKGIRSISDEQDIGERTFESDSNCNRNDTVRGTYR
ncbi:MAG: hypothetical protein IJZ53_00535 [Tyzzerella sp.]|nr:hypothetical protein [Tyzzerella sp.]